MVKFLGEILQDIRSVTERLLDTDLVMARYLKVKRRLDDVMLPYKKLHKNLWQSAWQLSITKFFHPGPSTSGAPAPLPASTASHLLSISSRFSSASAPSPTFLSVHNSSPSPVWSSDDSTEFTGI